MLLRMIRMTIALGLERGGGLCRFIGHVIPDVGNLDSTLSTLRFGERARGLPSRLLRFKTEPQLQGLLQNVQEHLTQTKKDLEIARMLTNLPACGYTSQDYADFTGQFIEKFERGEIDAHALLTNVDPKITLQVFKDLHTRCVEERKALEQRAAECEESLLAARTALESGSPRPSLASRGAARRSTGAKRTSRAEPRAVGDSTKSGISIGPGLVSEFEGPATRDMKHKKVVGSLKEKPIRKKR
ncbi:uncharacterized protein LOC134537098 [Bacillus rossius redtenbacheri]|uniref:uncharacterized protein LOC134537098 n=1 Tax=Bacillus rossius redtenbacheri TaxID=93214 RepID=UPI002FDEEB09